MGSVINFGLGDIAATFAQLRQVTSPHSEAQLRLSAIQHVHHVTESAVHAQDALISALALSDTEACQADADEAVRRLAITVWEAIMAMHAIEDDREKIGAVLIDARRQYLMEFVKTIRSIRLAKAG